MTPDAIKNLAIRHQVYLERLKAGVVRDTVQSIRDTEKSLLGAIKKLEVTSVNELGVRELNKLLADLRDIEVQRIDEVAADVMDGSPRLIEAEMQFEAKAMQRMIGGTVAVPDTKAAFAKVLKNPMSIESGQLLQPFVDNMTPRQVSLTEGAVRRAWAEGGTVQDLVRRIRGTRESNFQNGITRMKTREAEAVARTAIQHVANAARQEVWQANADIVDGYEILATLDSKTTPICRGLDGQKFKLGKGPTPPLHVNCRSTTVPSFDDGLDFLDEGATRSGEFGPVDANTKYYDWLKTQDRAFIEQTLGKERAALFLDEGLTPEAFRSLSLDKNFRPLTVAEMRSKLLVDVQDAPLPTTTSGRIWAISERLKGELGRVPTRQEVLAVTTSEGINSATASTQFARWKKEGQGTAPAPAPAPAPKPAPAPTPIVVTGRQGMPGKGATRTVWLTADELSTKLGREPTRSELLAETRKLGLNDATASTQFGKWKKAPLDGAPAAPKPVIPKPTPKPSGPLTPQQKEAEWAIIKKRIDDALTDAPKSDQGFDSVSIALNREYADMRDEVNQWKQPLPGAGFWRPGVPDKVRSRYADWNMRWTQNKLAGKVDPASFRRTFMIPESSQRPLELKAKAVKGTSKEVESMFKRGAERFQEYIHPRMMDKINQQTKMRGGFGIQQITIPGEAGSFDYIPFNVRIKTDNWSTMMHELAHSLEYVDSDTAKASRAFLLKRADGEKLHILFSDVEGYDDEFEKRGNRRYSGRDYGKYHWATELISTGIERMETDPVKFAKQDRDYFDFMVKAFHGLL